MAEFENLGNDHNIPLNDGSVSENALNLMNPDSVLSGSSRGSQMIGSPQIVVENANTRIRVNDLSKDRVLFGKIGSGANDWGLKVSKPNIDVKTASNDQLIFNSAQNVFKIIGSGTYTQTISSSGTTLMTIPHSLGYAPIAVVYLAPFATDPTSTYLQIPAILGLAPGATSITVNSYVGFSVSSTNLYITYSSQSSGFVAADYTFKYYYLQESVS